MPPGVHKLAFLEPKITAAFSGRNFPESLRSEFLTALNIDSTELVLAKQVHGAEIITVHTPDFPKPTIEADGLLTRMPGIALGIVTADCLPVFFSDMRGSAVGIAHAGWRGLKAGILEKMIYRLKSEMQSDPAFIQIAIGPCIRRCCYEVGEEFKEYFPDYFFVPRGKSKARVDLARIAYDQLQACGIREEHIEDTNICTFCDSSLFSVRREKTSERILSVIRIHP